MDNTPRTAVRDYFNDVMEYSRKEVIDVDWLETLLRRLTNAAIEEGRMRERMED